MKLDHCVLPTASLSVARERLAALGFTVAPNAAHPFGTANCCVFFQDGTYLEPLAIGDEGAAAKAGASGNTFVLQDRAFRDSCGEDGFSALAFGTDDAASDHTRFVEEGLSAGAQLSFSRPFVEADGSKADASFKLAFAAPQSSPSFFFTCERVKMPAADRSSLQRHDNGVFGISRILATAEERSTGGEFLSRLLRKQADDGAGIWSLSNGAVWLLAPEEAKRIYGIEAGDDNVLGLRGIMFRTTSISALVKRLAAADILHRIHGNRLIVPPAAGQGAYFVFAEPEKSSYWGLFATFAAEAVGFSGSA
ncbi:VOC family protein [Chelativorans xinjiangense]|uniref:VOC family protein n=1 Tax=Chelativorans xinjiangense TaxID=2681485 RepID=UPI00135AED96|nr:VOC family protein [Chelativorans xinjiangense]